MPFFLFLSRRSFLDRVPSETLTPPRPMVVSLYFLMRESTKERKKENEKSFARDRVLLLYREFPERKRKVISSTSTLRRKKNGKNREASRRPVEEAGREKGSFMSVFFWIGRWYVFDQSSAGGGWWRDNKTWRRKRKDGERRSKKNRFLLSQKSAFVFIMIDEKTRR